MSRHIVIEGNLTRDPTGGYGKDTGKAYTHLDVAVTDRARNTQGDWVDGPVTYYRVTVFGKAAGNATNSLAKGNTVIVTGDLTVRAYTRTDGTPGIAHEIRNPLAAIAQAKLRLNRVTDWRPTVGPGGPVM